MYANVCMLCMICKCVYDMHDPNRSSMEQSYACNSKCENEVLPQQLVDLILECFEVGTSAARTSDTVPLTDDQLADEVHGLMIMLY